jgi:hypothetical protein
MSLVEAYVPAVHVDCWQCGTTTPNGDLAHNADVLPGWQ